MRIQGRTEQRVRIRLLLAVLLSAIPPAAAQNCTSAVFRIHIGNAELTTKEAADYKPGARGYYVRDFNDSENVYLKAALSASRRKSLYEQWDSPELAKCIDGVLNELAAVARKTLPSYRPTGFTVKNAAEEQVLRTGVNDIGTAKVLQSGLTSATWKIETNRLGIPTARFKHGMIYAKYPALDDGFCRIIHVNLVQDYAGGGTYAASKARLIKSEFAGCP